jgi:regulatory protein
VQNRGEFKPLSPRALRQELRQKGVADEVIGDTLAEVDDAELAYKAASAQVRRFRNPTRRDFKTRLGNLLQRRGFSYSTTRDVVLRLIDELEAQDPNYFQSVESNEE